MNRVDRLTGILLLLHDRARARCITAEEIATHYEVSRRTVLRDVQALCEMGVPVQAQEGPGGGYRLPSEYRLTPLPLTANESLLMLLALSALEKLADAPYAPERATLRAKLRTLVTARQERDLSERLAAISYDVPERSFSAPHLETLLAAAQEGRWLRVVYRSMQRVSTQKLLPRRLTTSGGFWYCDAYALEHREERRYRADRFVAVECIPPPVAAMPANESVPYADPSHPEVQARLTPQGVLRVEREPHLGDALVLDEDGGGLWRFRCPPSEYAWLAKFILGLGDHAEVLAPANLRALVASTARSIAARHGAQADT